MTLHERYFTKGASDVMDVCTLDREHKNPIEIVGEYFDEEIINGKSRVIHAWKHNLIVTDFGRLLAALCKAHPGYTGITHWEVGSGLDAWDTNLPSPQVGDLHLTTPLARVPVTIVFLDGSNVETSAVTNKIEMRAYFDETTANGPLREFGVFGGNSTSALGSGIMCDRVIHQVVYKSNNMALQRKLRFTF